MEYLELFEIINKYYPVGFDDSDPEYSNFSGYLNLEKLCAAKKEQSQDERWKSLLIALSSVIPKKPNGKVISQPFYPCFSASYELFVEKTQNITYTRELQIHISVLGPLFTMFGVETVTLNKLPRTLEPLIFISPASIYKEPFESGRKLISDFYPKYKFISFSKLENRVPGLRIPGAVNYFDQDASYYQAFFMPDNLTNCLKEGDFLYE